jgi:hypothetical protein
MGYLIDANKIPFMYNKYKKTFYDITSYIYQ